MSTAVRIGAYGAGLAVVFAAAYGVGGAVGEIGPAPSETSHTTHAAPGQTPAAQTASDTPGGLQVSAHGYTLDLETDRTKAGQDGTLRFTIRDAQGEPVTAYRTVHDKELHLIVADRDLTVFRHLHPVRDAEGVWTTPVDLPRAGSHRVFADFTPEGAAALTLGADLAVAGQYEPAALPEPSTAVTVDGYTVSLRGDVPVGASGTLTFTVSRDGAPVAGLEPYLGSYGHLVALRAGDLAYLHVHPTSEADESVSDSPEVAFAVSAPSAGAYRLFLDFKIDGVVRTAAFTVHAGAVGNGPVPLPSESDEHGDHSH
ncbi:hypothetical protein LO762_21130 [Actinocorallia sp. API 0066]|uniref:hypothetical protein n=1 Tax=Actinocorallia sp. API 0066 TaxID=2896846 RepID=UPI001E47FC55|nr:hypothetical protein [Actinocorallia sp. API 0066]MCD0451679.1 hypothetical protein [Actinocorallia sp. API 0066]